MLKVIRCLFGQEHFDRLCSEASELRKSQSENSTSVLHNTTVDVQSLGIAISIAVRDRLTCMSPKVLALHRTPQNASPQNQKHSARQRPTKREASPGCQHPAGGRGPLRSLCNAIGLFRVGNKGSLVAWDFGCFRVSATGTVVHVNVKSAWKTVASVCIVCRATVPVTGIVTL